MTDAPTLAPVAALSLALAACSAAPRILPGPDAGAADAAATDAPSPVDAGKPRPSDGGSHDAGTPAKDAAPACSMTVCSSGGWCQSNPAPMFGGPLWAASPTDVWAGGRNDGTVVHWDGCNGTILSVGPPLSVVKDLWGSGANDVYAVLQEYSAVGDHPSARVAHWDGSAWSVAYSFPGEAYATLVAGSGPNDVWVIPGTDTSPSSYVHFDGSTWTTGSNPGADAANGIWVGASNDVWLAAVNGQGHLQHWDGASWTSYDTLLSGDPIPGMYGVWGSAADDVWAVGWDNVPLHWDGTGWSASNPVSKETKLTAIWGSGPNDVWASGKGPSAHWDGKKWSTSKPSFEAGDNAFVRGIAGSGPSDVWITGGSEGTLHFDGTSWTPLANDHLSQDGVGGIWGSGPDDVWVGADGCFLHWNGSLWSRVDAGLAGYVSGIWGSAANDIWAAGGGSQPQLLHYDGTTWTATGTTFNGGAATGLWGSGRDDVWLVDSSEPALHWDGKSWTATSSKTPTTGIAVWGSGPSDVWIAGTTIGSNGQIVHFDGKDWSVSLAGTGASIWGSGPTDVWATLANSASTPAKTYRYDGTKWTLMDTGKNAFYALWGTGPDDVWSPKAHWNGKRFEDVPTCGYYSALWGSSAGIWATGGDGIAFHK